MNFLVNVNNEGKINPEFIEKLKQLREKAKKNQWSINSLVVSLQKHFLIEKRIPITKDYKKFLGGFILGEGSLNLSLKKKQELTFGVALDLEFSVTQSIYAVSHLINLLSLFQAGRLDYKVGSKAVFVFEITNRASIFEKVFPFWEKYILPYQSFFEAEERFLKFKKLKTLFENKAHQNEEAFLNQMLPLWDSLRKQKDQTNQSFDSLEDAQEFVQNHISQKKQ